MQIRSFRVYKRITVKFLADRFVVDYIQTSNAGQAIPQKIKMGWLAYFFEGILFLKKALKFCGFVTLLPLEFF